MTIFCVCHSLESTLHYLEFCYSFEVNEKKEEYWTWLKKYHHHHLPMATVHRNTVWRRIINFDYIDDALEKFPHWFDIESIRQTIFFFLSSPLSISEKQTKRKDIRRKKALNLFNMKFICKISTDSFHRSLCEEFPKLFFLSATKWSLSNQHILNSTDCRHSLAYFCA